MKANSKINSFKDLHVWQVSHALAMEIYKLSKNVKKTSLNYEIWRQILRSAFSVPANIVEGANTHKGKSYASHLEIARGSASETQYWLLVLKEINDIKTQNEAELSNKYLEVIKMLSRMVNVLNSKP